MDSLAEIYKRHSGLGKFNDKNSTHSYIEIYESLLAPYRETASHVLEVGIFDGHSMRMFSEYFLNAEVHGIDCTDQPHGGKADLRPMIAEGIHNIHIIDAEDKEATRNTFSPETRFEVIVEDANHSIEQQLKIFENFKSYLADDGIYIIEDIARLDRDRKKYEEIGARIIDRRRILGRFDDVLAVIGGNR